MTEEELEKHTFMIWCRDATTNDLEKAKRENNEVWKKLYIKYADEIKIMRNRKGRIVNMRKKSK